MSQTITYKCDNCGHEQKDSLTNPRQMWTIGIMFASGIRSFTSYNNSGCDVAATQTWCRPCMEKVGVVNDYLTKQSTPELPKPPTTAELIEQLMRSIAREVAEEVVAEQR